MLNLSTSTHQTAIDRISRAIELGAIPYGEQTAARKQQIILFIRMHNRQFGVPPSLREIAAGIGVSDKSYAMVGQWANQLVEEGFLLRPLNGRRSLKVHPHPPRRNYYTLPHRAGFSI